MGALLLVVLSCNTFEETMVNLYTSVFGGWFDLGTMPRPSPAVESLTST